MTSASALRFVSWLYLSVISRDCNWTATAITINKTLVITNDFLLWKDRVYSLLFSFVFSFVLFRINFVG